MTEIGTVRQVGRIMFLEGHYVPYPNRAEPKCKFWDLFVPLTLGTHSTRNDNQILHGYQTRCQGNFFRVDHEC